MSKLRYGKVCILADADPDGYHIAALLCALFLKHFRSLVEDGRIYVAMPPLYRIDQGKDVYYALDTVTGVRYIEYDSYDSDSNGIINNLDDGDELFWEVQQPYWSDLIQFLDNNLKLF